MRIWKIDEKNNSRLVVVNIVVFCEVFTGDYVPKNNGSLDEA